MSAICGFYNLTRAPIDLPAFDRVLSALDEFGRDGSARWCEGHVAFGHQMTWLTPESRHESLPFYDGDSRLAITADARIDNRDDLCAALDLKANGGSAVCNALDGSSTQQGSDAWTDSQLILRAYQKWGPECPTHLLGDFAFAIWDQREQRLFCARDILGVRPFYYHLGPRQLIFASDMCGLVSAPGVTNELDLSYVAAHFRHRGNYPHDTHTWYAGIKKLARAHSMIVNAHGLKTWAYWDPKNLPEVRCGSDDEYAEMLRDLLDQSVRARIRSAYPVGAHLSGGLDSSSIAVLASRMLGARGESLTGFSWSPPPVGDEQQDERKAVEEISRLENIPVHYSRVTFDDILANRLRNLGTQRDAGFVRELVARRTAESQGIRCILSGWGGDELIAFNGCGYFAELFHRGRWWRLWRESRMRADVHDYSGALWKWIVSRAIFPLLPDWVFERFYAKALPARWDPSPLPDAFLLGFRKQLNHAEPLPRRRGRERAGVRLQQLFLVAHGHLTHRIEGWAAAGGTMGITYAYPLLDRRIVELALGLPPEMFFKSGWKRFLFRHALEGVLPDQVRWARNKTEPALIHDRDRLRHEAVFRPSRIVSDLLKEPRTYHALDIERARCQIEDVLATEYDVTWTPAEESRTEKNSVVGAFLVEIMVNPDLDRVVKEYLLRPREPGSS